MTREEAIICKIYLEDLDKYHTCNEYKLLMGLLEQEPCKDAISREDALQALCKAVHKNDDTIPCLNQRVSCLWDKTKVQDYAEEILKLPPVTPAEKVGQWIPVSEKYPEENGMYLVTLRNGEMALGIWIGFSELWVEVTAWMPLPEPYTEGGEQE